MSDFIAMGLKMNYFFLKIYVIVAKRIKHFVLNASIHGKVAKKISCCSYYRIIGGRGCGEGA